MKIQKEVRAWGLKNFPGAAPYYCVLGVCEEVGELSAVHLKRIQGIRKERTSIAAEKDAIGDIVIFLLHLCAMQGYDLETVVNETWEKVQKRDWQKNPDTGV